jgi:hypothetical protein
MYPDDGGRERASLAPKLNVPAELLIVTMLATTEK